jgi:ABC-type multidrug transport system permease subunit
MRGILAVLFWDYRFRSTNYAYLFWDLFVPISYLLIFGYGFEKALSGSSMLGQGHTNYASFFFAGILTMTTFNISMQSSWRFFMERESGIFYEVLTYPISRRELVIGKIVSNILLSLAGSMLAIGLGMWLLDLHIRAERLGLTMLGVGLGTAGWFFFFTIFALRMRRTDTFNTFTSACYILLMFASSLFYPLESLPAWFRIAARLNPITWETDALRLSTIGSIDGSMVLVESLAFCGFMILSFIGAVWAVNRAGE